MSRKFRNAALLCATLAIAVPVQGAQAAPATPFSVELVGYAYLDAPICYPGLGCNKGATIGFTFKAGNEVTDGKPTLCRATTAVKTTNAATECGINASGNIGPTAGVSGPWCGQSSGQFGGDIIIKGANGTTVNFSGTYVSAGSQLLITGSATDTETGQTGPFAGIVDAAPDATQGESCASGADKFVVAGTVSGLLV